MWVNEVWPSDRLGMMGNATRKDSGRETRLLEIILRLPRYWDRVRKFSVIFGFSSRFACTGNRRFVCYVILRNGLRGCVCFSKTLKNDYSFTSFRDRVTYLAFTVVSVAETLKLKDALI